CARPSYGRSLAYW
nr:immunoglobulin heavy chain junction region [Mus musculus]